MTSVVRKNSEVQFVITVDGPTAALLWELVAMVDGKQFPVVDELFDKFAEAEVDGTVGLQWDEETARLVRV